MIEVKIITLVGVMIGCVFLGYAIGMLTCMIVDIILDKKKVK